MLWDAINAMRNELADNRIKCGVDYALTYKYDQLHVLCHRVWVETITEAATRHGLTITAWHTYL